MKILHAALLISGFLGLTALAQNEPVDPLHSAREAAARGDQTTAMELLKAEAAKGNGAAANAIGEAILRDLEAGDSAAEAAQWFEKAIEAGDASGHYNFAALLTTAPAGVKKDPERASFLLQQSAEKNYAPAQFEFGRLLESKIDIKGPKPDWSKPRAWIEKAAKQGHPGALFLMVRYCDEGRGGKVDPVAGTDYCILAAKSGLTAAFNMMGLRYQTGTGIRQDNLAAVGWFTRAVQDGYAPAHVNLGKCYADGIGLRQDHDRAGEQFSAAAKQNHAPGEFMLGQLFERGLGTEPDPVKAFVLYSRAAAHELAEAEELRDQLGAKLDSKQKALAAKQLAIALGAPAK
jgi:TPR repeat protein